MLIALAQFSQDRQRFKNKTTIAKTTITITIKHTCPDARNSCSVSSRLADVQEQKTTATLTIIITITITLTRLDAHNSCSVSSGLSEVQ